MFYCGIDIAKRNHEASFIDAEGKPLLDSISITSEIGDINRFDASGKLVAFAGPYEAMPPKKGSAVKV